MAAGAPTAGDGGSANTPRCSRRGHPVQPVGVSALPAAKTAVRIGAAEEIGGCGHGGRSPVIHSATIAGPTAATTTTSS